MKRITITLILIVLTTLTSSCSKEAGYYEDIIEIYLDPSNPETLRVSTSILTDDSDYIIPNDGSSEFTITMVEAENQITFDFKAQEYVDRLSLLQYKHDAKTEVVPFKEVGKHHFILKKPTSSFRVPASGVYKFTVIRYKQCDHCW